MGLLKIIGIKQLWLYVTKFIAKLDYFIMLFLPLFIAFLYFRNFILEINAEFLFSKNIVIII